MQALRTNSILQKGHSCSALLMILVQLCIMTKHHSPNQINQPCVEWMESKRKERGHDSSVKQLTVFRPLVTQTKGLSDYDVKAINIYYKNCAA